MIRKPHLAQTKQSAHRYILACLGGVILLTFGWGMRDGAELFMATAGHWVIWGTVLAVFTIHEMLFDPVDQAGWFGVRGLSVLLAGFLLGTDAALYMVGVGVLAATLVRVIRYQAERGVLLRGLVMRGALASVPLLVVLMAHHVFGLGLPLMQPLQVAAVLGVVMVSFVGAHLLGGLLVAAGFAEVLPIWDATNRASLLSEFIVVAEVVPLVMIGQQLPGSVLMLVIAGLALPTLLIPSTGTRATAPLPDLPSSLDMTALLKYIDGLLMQLVPSRVTFLALYNPDTSQLLQYILVCVDGSRQHEGFYILQPGSPEAQIIASGQAVHITTNAGIAPTVSLLPVERIQPADFLGAPLRKDGQIIGLVGVMGSERLAHPAQAITALERVAQQVGLAIENARVYGNRARTIDNLSRMNKSVQALLFNLDNREAIETICRTAMQITRADRAAVFLVNEDTNEMELSHGINLPDIYQTALATYRFERSQTSGRVIPHIELSDEAELIRQAKIGDFQAMAETVLTSANRIKGVLVVYHRDPYDYPETERNLLQALASQITVALENTELLRALEMYASEMGQLVHLSRTSLTSLLPEEVARKAIHTLQQMFKVDSVVIATIEPVMAGNDVINVLGQAPQDLTAPHRQSLNVYPELQRLRDVNRPLRQLIHVDDPHISRGMRQRLIQNEEQSVVVIPMSAQREIFGVIMMGIREKRVLAEREWQFIETATNLTASQIQNAQLYNATRAALVRRLEQLSFIELVVQQISSSFDIENITESILDATIRVTQANIVTLARRSYDGRYRVIRQEVQDKGAITRKTETTNAVSGALARVFETGETILSAAYGLPQDTQQTPLLGRYPSLLAVPLLQESESIGVLCVESKNRNYFTEEQRDFLQNLAGHMVISLANAQLMEQRREQIALLSRLRQLSLVVVGQNDRYRVGKHILQTAAELLNGKQAGMYHYNPREHQLQMIAVPWRADDQQARATRKNLGISVLTPDRAKDILAGGDVRLVTTTHTNGELHTIVYIPLIRGENIHDLIVLRFEGERTLSKADLEAIDLLTTQATGHMENVVLYEQVQSNSKRMRAILESTHDGIMLLDRNNGIVDYNTIAEKMLGVKLGSYQGEDVNKLPVVYEETEREEIPQEMMNKDGVITYAAVPLRRVQMNIRRPNGDILYLERTELPVQDAKSRIMGRLLVLRDVTEERELAHYRDEIIFMLVHDLRSPLGSTISAIEYAEELAAKPDERDSLAEVLYLAKRSAKRLMNLINTLLDVERDQMTLIRSEWDIDHLVEEAHTDLAYAAKEVGIDIHKIVEPGLPTLKIDGEKIQRVLINLIDNALDYSEQQIIVSVKTSPDGSRVVMRVNDDGPGIPPEKRTNIFGKFTQATGQERRRGKHSGIGLTYCRRAVEAHGGNIWVSDGTEGCTLKGACFVFTLPLSPPPTEQTVTVGKTG